MPDIKFTQREVMHMSGQGFSVMAYEVFADGQPTAITRNVRTNGRSGGYRYIENYLACGDDEFNLLSSSASGRMQRWLEEHLPAPESALPTEAREGAD